MNLRTVKILKAAGFTILPLALAVGCTSNGVKTTSIETVEKEVVVEKSLDDMFKDISDNLISESMNSESVTVENQIKAEEIASSEAAMEPSALEDTLTHTDTNTAAVETESDGFMQVNLSEPDTGLMSLPEKTLFNFGANQSQISETDIEILQQHAAYLMTNPGKRLVVEAHSDAQGSAAYNYKLSGKRAEYIVNILVTHGVPSDLIKVNNYGESFPLHDEKNWDENRRVEIKYENTDSADDLLVSAE
ncbi:MAG: OmpA family protein [Gammaproteobacteria bacterium]|nr:OmpA family protein [Gammaproteobacteria bacterium]MDH5802465.1 OmpA family protein [Gammaproteobacteria bacterium]